MSCSCTCARACTCTLCMCSVSVDCTMARVHDHARQKSEITAPTRLRQVRVPRPRAPTHRVRPPKRSFLSCPFVNTHGQGGSRLDTPCHPDQLDPPKPITCVSVECVEWREYTRPYDHARQKSPLPACESCAHAEAPPRVRRRVGRHERGGRGRQRQQRRVTQPRAPHCGGGGATVAAIAAAAAVAAAAAATPPPSRTQRHEWRCAAPQQCDGVGAYVEDKVAQSFTSWLCGGLLQCQITPQAAPSLSQPRPTSRSCRMNAGRPHRPYSKYCTFHMGGWDLPGRWRPETRAG